MSAKKFRKKPLIVEAMQYNGLKNNIDKICEWAAEHGTLIRYNAMGVLSIPTPAGNRVALENDWIVMSSNGEFYPCTADAFEATYEKFEEAPNS